MIVYGEVLLTADMSGTPRVTQRVEFAEDTELRAYYTWMILLNDPAFTAASMRVWSDSGNAPASLITTSTNSFLKAQILTTEDHGWRGMGFEFLDRPVFKAGDIYHFQLHLTGYTGTAGSHVAWELDWPKRVYTSGVSSFESLLVSPYVTSIIGAEL